MSSPGNILAFCGRLFMSAAAAISLYLASSAMGRTPLPGCEPGSPCAKALQSPWAFVFGLPVSFPGFVIYLMAVLLSGAFVRREQSLAGLEASAVMATAVTAAIWFGCLQVVELQSVDLQSLCLWCLLSQGLAVAGVVLLFGARMRHPVSRAERNRDQAAVRRTRTHSLLSRLAAGGAAMVCAGVLALGAWSNTANRKTTEGQDAPPSIPAALHKQTAVRVQLFEIQRLA